MSVDHTLPTVDTNYLQFPTLVHARINDVAKMFPTQETVGSIPTGSVGWNSTAKNWTIFNGTSWEALATSYAISITGSAASATTATKLATARAINGTNFDGSANITITANTANSIVFSDTGGAAIGTSFNGSAARTISYATVGAPSTSGTNATGTWGISITGNASTATTATNATNAAITAASTGTFYLTFVDATSGNRSVKSSLGLSYDAATGDLTASGNITAYSDKRLKENLVPISDALGKLKTLTGYTYTLKTTQACQTGLLANDVQKVLPEAVVDNGEYLSLAYGNLAGLFTQAIKELDDKLESIKKHLNIS